MVEKLSSSELKAAIIGMILGDAYMDVAYRHCRLDIYVDYRNEDFAILKRDILRQVGNMKVTMAEKIDGRKLKGGNVRRGFRIQTETHPYLTKIKNIPLFKKPEMLTPLGLAIWYMDDGSLSIRKSDGNFVGCYLATNRYPIEFVEHAQWVLKEKFGLSSQIQRHNPNGSQYMLRFRKDDCLNLSRLILPYTVDSMKYKLLGERGGRLGKRSL